MSPLGAVKGDEQGQKNIVYRVAIHNTFIAFPMYSPITTSNSRSEPLRYKIFADIAPDFIREHVGKGGSQRNCSRRALIPEGTAWAGPDKPPQLAGSYSSSKAASGRRRTNGPAPVTTYVAP